MPDSFDYTTGTNSENVRLLQALIDDAPEYTEETNSRNANILKSIINNTEYTDAPQSEIEELLLRLKAKIGGEIEVDELNVTENGTYDAGVNKAYNPVTVAVEGYAKKSIENTPTPIATFNASALPMPSLKVGIEAQQSGTGDPSPTNIRPFTGWSAVNVTRASENLFNGEYPYVDNTTRKLTLDVGEGSFTMVSTIPVYVNAGQNVANIFLQTGTGDATASSDLDGVWAGHPITVNSTDGKVTIKYRIFNNIGVCDPRRYDTWLARSITTYNTALKDGQGNPLTCYGGELSNTNGVQSLDNAKNIVDLGTRIWTYDSATQRFLTQYKQADMKDLPARTMPLLCTGYLPISDGRPFADVPDFAIYTGTQIIVVHDSRYTDVASFTQAVSGVMLVYELATPQTIPQDNLAISTQDGTNNLWADTGDIQSGEYLEAL